MRRNRQRRKDLYPGIGDVWGFFTRLEGWIIRGLILGTLLLVIVQYGMSKDPVEFYLAMAGKVESPAIEVNGYLKDDEPVYTVRLKAVPAAPVNIVQNGQIIASLGKGEVNIPLSADAFILDGRGVSQAVSIQIVEISPAVKSPAAHQIINLENNAVSLKIVP